MNRTVQRSKKLALFAMTLATTASALRADVLWIGSGKNAIKVEGVHILSVAGDKLSYATDSGVQTSKPLSQLPQINVDGDSNFNSAENGFAKADYDTAITGYQAVLKSSSSKDWMQIRAANRLLISAKAKNRFDAEVDAYISLLQKDPATAALNKPAAPEERSQYLDAALASISRALSGGKLEAAQKSSLLGLQLQVDQAKGDTTAVNATLKQLVDLGGASDSDKAMLKVMTASVALGAKQYADAISNIEQNRAFITSPDQQVEALWVLAEAKRGLATDALTSDKPDADVLKDLALNYMRVATFSSQLTDRPHVPESLFQAGQLEEKLKEPQAAVGLYQQIVREKAFANSPVVPMAQARIDALGKSK